jgi:hypothetical protein
MIYPIGLLTLAILFRGIVAGPSCSWQVFFPPNRGQSGVLDAQVVLSSDDVWAAGSYGSKQGHIAAQVVRFDGKNWSRQVSPHGKYYVDGMTAFSDSDVWIVGARDNGASGTSPLILNWNGKRWTEVSHPLAARQGELFGIVRVERGELWTAGFIQGPVYFQPVVEHFNGKSWIVDNGAVPPNQAVFQALAGTSSENLWAGGYGSPSGGAFVERRDGSENDWIQTPTPAGTYVDSMSARSSNEVWAIGPPGAGSPFILRWNGSQWSSIQYKGQSTELIGVDATSSTGYTWFTGVADDSGMYTAHIERYKNGQWQDMRVTQVGAWQTAPDVLASVPGSADLWAVGYYANTSSERSNLAERWTCPAGSE